jgi:flagellar biosynthesis protein FlhG
LKDQAENLRKIVKEVAAAKNCADSKLRSIAIVSGKGGVGKSNITVFLAKALAMRGKKVLIFDGDVGLANLHILLGVLPKATLTQYIKNACPVRNLIHHVSENIDLIPGGSGDVSPNSDLRKIIGELIDVSQEYDYLLIDGGAGISENTIRLSISSGEVILVATPDPTSLADAYATLKVLVSRGQKNISLLINMTQNASETELVKSKLTMMSQKFIDFKLDFLGVLPKSEKLATLIREDIGILSKKVGDFSLKINTVAAKIDGEENLDTNNNELKNFFAKFVQVAGGKE